MVVTFQPVGGDVADTNNTAGPPPVSLGYTGELVIGDQVYVYDAGRLLGRVALSDWIYYCCFAAVVRLERRVTGQMLHIWWEGELVRQLPELVQALEAGWPGEGGE